MKEKLKTFIHLKDTEINFEVTAISYYPNVGERLDFIQALDDKDLMTIYNLFDESLKNTLDKLYNDNKGNPLYGSRYNYMAKCCRLHSSFVVKSKTYEMRHSDEDRMHFVVSVLDDSMRKEQDVLISEIENREKCGEVENTLLIEENATLRKKIQSLETELSESEEERGVLQSEVWELKKELDQKRNGEGED